MYKPIIAIASSSDNIAKGIYQKPVYLVNKDYIDMINKHGGIPIIIPYSNDLHSMKKYLKEMDALLLIGGEDVSSKCFIKEKSSNPRDNFEIAIYKYFKKNKKPILGICRGMQIINVAEGGTLKDITESKIKHYIEQDGWINYHNLIIEKNTKLNDLLDTDIYTISSVHHQQIDKLGKSLKVSSYSTDHVIEAIELKGDEYIIGIQGHIEKCLDNFDKYNAIVKEFIKEAQNGKK